MIIEQNVRGTDLYVFQSPVVPDDPRSTYDRFVMLLHAIEAAALSDAEWVTAVVPYFPGARQDKRKGRVREGISAGLFARMLQEAGAHRVVTVDIHNEAIAGMFNPIRCRLENVHLYHFADFIKVSKPAGDFRRPRPAWAGWSSPDARLDFLPVWWACRRNRDYEPSTR